MLQSETPAGGGPCRAWRPPHCGRRAAAPLGVLRVAGSPILRRIRGARAMPELRTNRKVEDAAIAWVLTKERAEGRLPKDVRYAGAPYDIESPPRAIEVKAVGGSNRGFGLWLEVSQMEEALRNPDFFLYVVENVRQGDPRNFTLKVLGGERLRRLLERAKERRYYEVPWPVADYDLDA